ncbi:Calcineurin B-like protein 10 [Zostera marina]|uniref:Calcineurin B-like protein n=1 Tax=Zostera marina TaxID=29655 RepID=A0A0K9Q4Y7_ZOSMR|nr:Calcineurin B-like protein 10 [Zostera marina]
MEVAISGSHPNSFTIGERLCGVFIPLIGFVETLFMVITQCIVGSDSWRDRNYGDFDEISQIFSHDCTLKSTKREAMASYDGYESLAKTTHFTTNEVEALYELFKKVSSSIINDGLIHKEELHLALFNSKSCKNLFLDRVFHIFDQKKNGVIEFEEFIHALSVFHPYAPLEEKIDFSFKMYDLRQTGFIEREEVEQMVIAILIESDIKMPKKRFDELIDEVTFSDADADSDGKINKEEWHAYVSRNPSLLRNMTLSDLKEVTTTFPSFVFNTDVEDIH